MKKTTNKNSFFVFFSKALPMLAAVLVTLGINSQTAEAATEYDIWIGGTQVTSDNAGNILGETNPVNGEPTASFDEATLTLTLNGVHITPDQYWVNNVHKEWNDPVPNQYYGGDYSETDAPLAVYSMFFGPLKGRTFATGEGNGTRGTIVIKGENVIDGYGVGILAGRRGYAPSGAYNPGAYDGGNFSIIGDGTLRINQLYSNKDGVLAPHGALNILEMPNIINFGEEKGKGPKIFCNGIKSGLYSGCETRLPRGTGTYISNQHTNTYLYGDTTIILQGGLIGFDARFGRGFIYGNAYNYFNLKDQAVLCARSTGILSDPYECAQNAAFKKDPSYSYGTNYNYITVTAGVSGMILGNSMTDVGNWVAYGPLTMDEDKLNELQMDLNLPIKNLQPDSESYFDPDINVWGFTGETTVYSVDVEWGAMTFQYEKSSWNAESHTTKEGGGWLVYDAVNEKALKSSQDAINQITVTNHSNAGVYATLIYTGEDGYQDTTGGFTKNEDDADTSFTDAAADVPAYLTLATADNNLGEIDGQGKETVGTVYFMPEGIAKTDDTINDITKWTKIGVITVGLLTEDPAAAETTP